MKHAWKCNQIVTLPAQVVKALKMEKQGSVAGLHADVFLDEVTTSLTDQPCKSALVELNVAWQLLDVGFYSGQCSLVAFGQIAGEIVGESQSDDAINARNV